LYHVGSLYILGNFLFLLRCTTNQRNITFAYLLQLLVQRHEGPPPYLLESIQFLPGIVKDLDTVDRESSQLK